MKMPFFFCVGKPRVQMRLLPAPFASVLLAALVTGCASIPPGAGADPRDPLEKVNRNVFGFNDAIDTHALRPVAEAYEKYVPRPVQSCIRNFFGNLADAPTALNQFLQGKVGDGFSDLCRVAINTTVGVLGCFDVASTMGLAKHDEDFGQTLGRWGVPPGPYLVLPLLGSSTVRDGIGRVADYRTQPQTYIQDSTTYYSVFAVDVVDTRTLLLPASRLIDQSGLDQYGATRDAYLQRRRNLVFDGNPPDTPDEAPPKYEDDDSAPATPAAGEANKPEAIKPETRKPDADKAETNKPETNKPETNKPETNKPETNKPETPAPAPKQEDNKSEAAKAGDSRTDAGQAAAKAATAR